MTIRLVNAVHEGTGNRWVVIVNSVAGSVQEDVSSQIESILQWEVHQAAIAALTEQERAKLAELADLKERVNDAVSTLGGTMDD